jgi:hypothetical protein
MAAELRLTLNADMADAFGGQHPVASAVGPAGEAVVLLVDEPEASLVREREEQPDRASFPRARTRRPVGATVLRHDGARAVATDGRRGTYRDGGSQAASAFGRRTPSQGEGHGATIC